MKQRQIEVQLENGGRVTCPVVSVGQFNLMVEQHDECFVVERRLGAWREVQGTREPAAWHRADQSVARAALA